MEELANKLASQLPEREARRYRLAIKSLGRPTKYDPDVHIPIMLYEYAKGSTICNVAAELGIAKSTYYLWLDKFDNFSDAHKKGRTMSRSWLEDQASENLDNRNYNFMLLESRMRREFFQSEQPHVNLPGFNTGSDADKIQVILNALASGELCSNQGLQLLQLIKTAQDVTALPDVLAQLDQLKDKLKEK